MHAMTRPARGEAEMPPFTVEEVALRLACSSERVMQLVRDQHLHGIWLGHTARTVRIPRSSLEDFEERGGIRGLADEDGAEGR